MDNYIYIFVSYLGTSALKKEVENYMKINLSNAVEML